MKIRHWTDQDIQRHIDEGGTSSPGARINHLRLCRACRRQISAYRKLAGMLSRQPPVTLSMNFPADVAARTLRTRAGLGLFSREWLWVLAALLFGLGAWIFLYQAPMLETFRLWFSQVFADFQPVVNAWSKGGRYLPWLAEGLGALVLAALLDRMVASFRARRLGV
jgi:hypothetical protein